MITHLCFLAEDMRFLKLDILVGVTSAMFAGSIYEQIPGVLSNHCSYIYFVKFLKRRVHVAVEKFLIRLESRAVAGILVAAYFFGGFVMADAKIFQRYLYNTLFILCIYKLQR